MGDRIIYSHFILLHIFTSLKAYGSPRTPAPMKEIKMLAKILTELSVPDPLLGPPTAMMDVDLPSGLDVIEFFF